jgi:hypothetical protein
MQQSDQEHTQASPPSQDAGKRRAFYRGLSGVFGAMRIETAEGQMGTLVVHDGHVEFVPGPGEGAAELFFEDPNDVGQLLRGKVNPVVASLQRRVLLAGDMALAARIILGLRSGASKDGE